MTIDWKKLVKKCRELKIYPDNVYNPLYLPFDKCAWFDLLSERSLGKTTSLLLMGMVAHELFGTIPEYVRLTDDMTKKKALDDLFKVCVQYKYISKITDGRWNNVFYYANYWRYTNTDESGKIIEKCEKPFMHVYSLTTTNKLKSAYNNPDGDIIIVDEFIDNQTPYADFFFYLCDSMSTVFRNRLGCKVFMLANTIDCRSVWFTEQGIMSDVSKAKIGTPMLLARNDMTPVYFEIIANTHNTAKQKFNDMYFKFKNPKLNAITGADTWAYSAFPIYKRSWCDEDGIFHKYEIEYLTHNIFIRHNGFYLQVLPSRHELYGNCVLVRNWNIEPDTDAIILVSGTPESVNEYNVRELHDLFNALFNTMYRNNKWYYRDNSTAMTVISFINSI